MGRVVEDIGPGVIGSGDAHTAAVGIEFEGRMKGGSGLGLVAPDDGVAVGGDGRADVLVGGRNLIFVRVGRVVAQEEAC